VFGGADRNRVPSTSAIAAAMADTYLKERSRGGVPRHPRNDRIVRFSGAGGSLMPAFAATALHERAIIQGAFGRATVNPLARALVPHVHAQYNILVRLDGPDGVFEFDDVLQILSPGRVLIFNPWQVHRKFPNMGVPTLFLSLLIEPKWLAALEPDLVGRPEELFPERLVEMTSEQQRFCEHLAEAITGNVTLDDATLEASVATFMRSLIHAHARPLHRNATLARASDARIRRAIQYLSAHVDENPSLGVVSAAVGMSRSRFFEQFKSCVGSSPQQYLDWLRVMRATHLLVETDKSVGDIAAELTFSEPTHFTRFFTQHVGLPPAEFRRRTTIVSAAKQR
jgi:AraC-like DNA-binding protein